MREIFMSGSMSRLVEAKRGAIPRRDVAAEHILLIGSNRLSLLYIKFIRAYSPGSTGLWPYWMIARK